MSLRASGLPRAFSTVNMLVRAIDVVGHVHGDVALVEQEVGEAPALVGVEVVERLVQMVAHRDDVFRAAGEIGLVHRHQRGARLAHVRLEERFVRLAQRSRGALRPRPIADGGQQPLVRRRCRAPRRDRA